MTSLKSLALAAVAGALASAWSCHATLAGPTLDKVKAAGVLTCGVSTGLAGFSVANPQGEYTGLDVDVCRAIAAAILGDAKKVKFVPTTGQNRFTALQSGEIDMLARNTTGTLTREADLGFNFALRRSRLHGTEEAQCKERERTQRRHYLRVAGDHDGAQSC
jgi:general L-amino acid transport system substrate-binding protein